MKQTKLTMKTAKLTHDSGDTTTPPPSNHNKQLDLKATPIKLSQDPAGNDQIGFAEVQIFLTNAVINVDLVNDEDPKNPVIDMSSESFAVSQREQRSLSKFHEYLSPKIHDLHDSPKCLFPNRSDHSNLEDASYNGGKLLNQISHLDSINNHHLSPQSSARVQKGATSSDRDKLSCTCTRQVPSTQSYQLKPKKPGYPTHI